MAALRHLARRLRGEQGAALVGAALVLPVSLGAVALSLFAAHAYEVKSDLRRVAQEAARYAATRCDPRGSYTSGCGTSYTYPTEADIAAHIAGKFRNVTFVSDCAGSLASQPALLCRTLTPSSATPAPNERVALTLQYRFRTPFAALLRMLPVTNPLVDLKATGAAVVE